MLGIIVRFDNFYGLYVVVVIVSVCCVVEWISFGDDLVCVVVFEFGCVFIGQYQYYWYVGVVVFDLVEFFVEVGVFDNLKLCVEVLVCGVIIGVLDVCLLVVDVVFE